MNFINDMIVKDNIQLDDESRKMLMAEFPEMTDAQAQSMSTYANYVHSDK